MRTEFEKHLVSLGACSDARAWASGKTATEAWGQCERPDWLLWWASHDGESKLNIVKCAAACARTALRFIPDGQQLPQLAIEAAERWCQDRSANAAAYAATYAAYAANAAAYAATYATYAADAAYAYAATYAAYAAAAAADAAAAPDATYAADAAAHAATYAAYAADAAYAAYAYVAHRQMCDIVRSIISQPWSEPK